MRWMAQELFLLPSDGRSCKHDEWSDIWAFGMVIYVRFLIRLNHRERTALLLTS